MAETTQSQNIQTKTVAAQYDTITAKVVGINKADHSLTLENDLGERRMVRVDPNVVKNFDQIKTGDNVIVRQQQTLALSLIKGEKGQKPSTGAAMEMETAAPGEKPGLEATKVKQISAEILNIDKQNQTVKLKGPKGNMVWLKVNDPSKLENLKKGDLVAATYRESLAISVEPAPKK